MMLKFKSLFWVLISYLFFLSCNPSVKNEVLSKSIESIAHKKYSEPIHYLENKNKLYTICYSQKFKTSLNPYPPLRFFVFDVHANKLIYEDNLANGTVKWVDVYKLEVSIIPGIIRIDQDDGSNKYIYDIQLKKKI